MSARKTNSGVGNVYDAAQEWVQRALLADDSLFTPGMAIWTLGRLRELHALQRQEPDASLPGFFGSWKKPWRAVHRKSTNWWQKSSIFNTCFTTE